MRLMQIIGAAAAGAALAAFCRWQNDGIAVTEMEYKSFKLGGPENKLQIVHISDFHNKDFGNGQEKILTMIQRQKPDYIFITGDLVDSRHTDVKTALDFVRGVCSLAPAYYVSGNHELRLRQHHRIFSALQQEGLNLLENQSCVLSCGASRFNLIGLPDPSGISKTQGNFPRWVMDEIQRVILREKREDMANVLLIHRPELLELYSVCGMDLVFCGHAHGGQIRLPLLGGVNAPNQGFFPPYTQGAYCQGDTTMVVSRGIGNSLAPQRLWNRPELISIAVHG